MRADRIVAVVTTSVAELTTKVVTTSDNPSKTTKFLSSLSKETVNTGNARYEGVSAMPLTVLVLITKLVIYCV